MVDVSAKPETLRTARASALVRMAPATLALIRDRGLAKGDVLGVARLAGIMAAKRTGELIPLAHPIPLGAVDVACGWHDATTLRIEARATTHGQTGVEMEAMVAASIAALTVYDMCKALDKGIAVESVRLLEKTGGKSGDWSAPS